MEVKKNDASNVQQNISKSVPLVSSIFANENVSSLINGFLSNIFNKNTNDIDRTIDASYNYGGFGNSATHHITDGNHTFWGAFHAAQNAHPNDPTITLATSSLEHLLRDFTTKSGINPFFSISNDNLYYLKDILHNSIGVSHSWVNHILTFNVFDTVGALISSLIAIFGFKKYDIEMIGRTIGSSSIASLVSGNSLLAVVAIIIATISWRKFNKKEKKDIIKKAIKGGVVTFAAITTSSIIGGPTIVTVATAVYTGYITNNVLSGIKCNDFISKTIKKTGKVLINKSGVYLARNLLKIYIL